MTFRKAAEQWFQAAKPRIKESTANKYESVLRLHLFPALGDIALQEFSDQLIEEHCQTLLCCGGKKKTGLSARTVLGVLFVLRGVLRFAVQSGQPVSCDARSIHIRSKKKEKRILSRGEQERLCRHLISDRNAYHMGILVSLFTGLRIGEVCALRWEDISLREKTIRVCRTMQRVREQAESEKKTKILVSAPKSASSVRTIPMPDILVRLIEEYQNHTGSTSGYFLSLPGKKHLDPRTLQNRFQQALKESGISKRNFHALRHTFATRCVELGFDVKSLSEILGHSSVNLTMNLYVHPTMELKKQNMKRLSALFAVTLCRQEAEEPLKYA